MRRRIHVTPASRGHRCGMRNQPSVHHVPGGFPNEVILHKLRVLVQPGLHPCILGIVAGVRRGTAGHSSVSAGPTAAASTSAAHMVLVVMMVMVMRVMMTIETAQLVMILAGGRRGGGTVWSWL